LVIYVTARGPTGSPLDCKTLVADWIKGSYCGQASRAFAAFKEK